MHSTSTTFTTPRESGRIDNFKGLSGAKLIETINETSIHELEERSELSFAKDEKIFVLNNSIVKFENSDDEFDQNEIDKILAEEFSDDEDTLARIDSNKNKKYKLSTN